MSCLLLQGITAKHHPPPLPQPPCGQALGSALQTQPYKYHDAFQQHPAIWGISDPLPSQTRMQCPTCKGGKQQRNLTQVALLQVQPFPDCSRVLFHQCWFLALLQSQEPSPPEPQLQEPAAAPGWKDTSLMWELPPAGFWYPSNASDTKRPRP